MEPLHSQLSFDELLALPAGIFIARLSDFDAMPMGSYLSKEESHRLSRFRFRDDARRYELAHSLKRLLIARRLGKPLMSIEFISNQHGKPLCAEPYAPAFNLSHSQQWVALVISSCPSVGIDIEFPRALDTLKLLHKVSSQEQLQRYSFTQPSMNDFLCVWTQKEAISKAHGQGISVGLKSIPCSGNIGGCELSFLSEIYYIYSWLMPDKGVLSYASTRYERVPIIKLSPGQSLADPVTGRQLFSFD